ncbi:22369_t:CDS:10, partial [Dentiscutata erythropus]
YEKRSNEQIEQTVIKRPRVGTSSSSLYLDTINRHMLDFDFEKVCSVSLSNLNVYACLVCGKYFQGRGRSSHAYFHSLHEDHHVFIHLHELTVYVLPDGYEVKDSSLDDIRNIKHSYDLNNKKYLPGFVDYFILQNFDKKSQLVQRFSTLVRKIWNPRAFKGQVSPHELLQEISNASNKVFKLAEQSDPIEFLCWFLNSLHKDLGGTKKRNSSIIHNIFQGEVKVESQPLIVKSDADEKDRLLFDLNREIETIRTPFLLLSLDLPPPPLFKDEVEKNIIPQIALTTILAKYDGRTPQ